MHALGKLMMVMALAWFGVAAIAFGFLLYCLVTLIVHG